MVSEYVKSLRDEIGEGLVETSEALGQETAVLRRSAWTEAARTLRGLGFDMLIDLCAVDYPEREERFDVVIHLRSTQSGKRLRVKTSCPEGDPTLDSLCGIWRGACWYEREAFDLMGIEFRDHPNLKRILCHEGFQGHALRKDFPKGRRGVIPKTQTLMDEMEVDRRDTEERPRAQE